MTWKWVGSFGAIGCRPKRVRVRFRDSFIKGLRRARSSVSITMLRVCCTAPRFALVVHRVPQRGPFTGFVPHIVPDIVPNIFQFVEAFQLFFVSCGCVFFLLNRDRASTRPNPNPNPNPSPNPNPG